MTSGPSRAFQSDDPESRLWWRELSALIDHEHVRAIPAYGACPICQRGATCVVSISTVQWALCDSCRTRWPAGMHLLPPEHDQRFLTLIMEELSAFTFCEETSMPNERPIDETRDTAVRSASRPPPPSPALDPRVIAALVGIRDPERLLHGVLPDVRAQLFRFAVDVASRSPAATRKDLDRLSAALWSDCRGRDITYGSQVSTVAIYLRDNVTNEQHVMRELMEVVLIGADVRASLLRHRDLVASALQRLAPLASDQDANETKDSKETRDAL